MKKYFGTDGIRGVACDFLNEELAFKVGTSLSSLNLKSVVVGRDTRESGSMLAQAIISGAKAVGMDTLYLGIVSTPMLSYISGQLGYVGVMITASHNPFTDNGIKVFKAGKKLFENEEAVLEAILNNEVKTPILGEHGCSLPNIDTFKLYKKLYRSISVKTSMKIGLDLANGSTYSVGKRIFKKITPNLKVIGDQPDGKNINLGVGSTHLEALTELVKREKLDVGFAFDGDGDRLLAVDYDGTVIDGDLLIYIIANYLKSKKLLQENTVVLTKMSNLGIIKALESQGIKTLQTDIGDKYVLEMLEQKQLTVGGENSGHIINRYLLNTGDGVLNSVLLVKIMKETKMHLNELAKGVELYPDKLVNLKNIDRAVLKDSKVIETVEAVKTELGSLGKVLVRASGTEPLIRVSIQAKTNEMVEAAIEKIVTIIKQQATSI